MVGSSNALLDNAVVAFSFRDMCLGLAEIQSDTIIIVLEIGIDLLEFIVTINSGYVKSIVVVETQDLVERLQQFLSVPSRKWVAIR